MGPQFQADLSSLHLTRHSDKSTWGACVWLRGPGCWAFVPQESPRRLSQAGACQGARREETATLLSGGRWVPVPALSLGPQHQVQSGCGLSPGRASHLFASFLPVCCPPTVSLNRPGAAREQEAAQLRRAGQLAVGGSARPHPGLPLCTVYENEDQLLWDPGVLPETEVEEFLYRAVKRRWQEVAGPQLPAGEPVRDSEQVGVTAVWVFLTALPETL